MGGKLRAEHGIVCRIPGERFGYFGWPSVDRMDDGTLVAASSGLRTQHICPFGKTVLNYSRDEGKTWSEPQVINNSPLDDRDAGVLNLGGESMLVSWFTHDTRPHLEGSKQKLSAEETAQWEEAFKSWREEIVKEWLGSWVLLSQDSGKTWSDPIKVPVSTPHGPIRLAGGDLLYLGKGRYGYEESREENRRAGEIKACRSTDGGRTWTELGQVPMCDGTHPTNYHEPHVVELEDGKLIGMIRFQYSEEDKPKDESLIRFSLFQTESGDGGKTWSQARPIGVYGSPPHLIRHSSGTIVCAYGHRLEPFGQRIMLSNDEGRTWDSDWILRDDGPVGDLGYPCSVEMPDGSIFTVYYQQHEKGEKCSLLWSRWRLP